MRLFLYEYTCANTASRGLTFDSLRAEGWAMLFALVEDLGRAPGVELFTLIEESATAVLASLRSCPVHIETAAERGEEPLFRELARRADGVLVIAPEFDELLLRRCQWVEEIGGRLLGPSSDAVRATGDKLSLARHWLACGIATPISMLLDSGSVGWPAVFKPRHGAGSQATFLVHGEDDLAACRMRAEQEGWRGEAILQPFVRGQACSVSFLIGARASVALPPCRQHLSEDGRFHYLGGSLPLLTKLAARAESLARRAVEVVPGLRGYIGVDLILGDATDGSEDWAIEINSRLTTSYIGLRALAKDNLAEAMLRVAFGEPTPELRWHSGPIHFPAGSDSQFDCQSLTINS